MSLSRASFVFAVLAFTPALTCSAQMGSAPPKIAPGTIIEPSVSIDAVLSNFEAEITGVAKAMPAEKYSFAPASVAPADFKGVRTFAEQLTHIISANYLYASFAGKMKPEVDMKAIQAMTDKDQIVAALAASFVFAHKAIATLTAANAFESVRGSQTRATLATGIAGHGFDHYGQLCEYLRMNGIIPPASAK